MENSVFRRVPQQQRSQERVEQILKAAADVFWESGYDAATTHAIARRAKTAVGTLYRFFPNKLAIFHELEKRHRKGVEETHTRMMTPEFMQQSLAGMIGQMVKTYADYFEDVGHRVVYIQYYVSPEMFVHFDDAVDTGFIKRLAGMLRLHNASLSIEKSELLAEVCHRSFNALLFSALRSDTTHRAQLYQELQTLLTNYLEPHTANSQGESQGEDGLKEKAVSATSLSTLRGTSQEEVETVDSTHRLSELTQGQGLTPRQEIALAHVIQHGSLNIQQFEGLCPEPSRRTLQRDLKQLIAKGLLQSEGDTTQLRYQLPTP
ncbi:MAG: TetR/AcrR family transcriptional regulator [Cyanobacteria bacterium P01_F01_bin.53]